MTTSPGGTFGLVLRDDESSAEVEVPRSVLKRPPTSGGGSVSGVVTLRHVASLLTATELEKLTLSVLAKLRPFSLVQRDTVIREILEDRIPDRGQRAVLPLIARDIKGI